ncbi:MAG TPA: amidohydrolase family protein [Candidatus Limnocylindrales bacterium]|nr:amidohydrolase family protein [Candidatus Limnocylindrales bacterium]
MALDLDAIPIVDNHCHSLLRRQPPDDEAFRNHLTESTFPEIARDHITTSLAYHMAIRELAVLLDCEPTPDAVHAARRERGVEWLTRAVIERANFKTWLIDTGYGADTTYSLDELRELAPCRIEEVLRLEPLIERLILESETFDGFIDAYRASLAGLRGRGIVGMKSVIAYRTGLHVGEVERGDAADAYRAARAIGQRDGRLRIESKPLLDFLIVIAVEEAGSQGVPIQFHTGLGDPDLDLTLVDPAALRMLFADRFRAAPIVLLHTGYPYIRSLAYLAAMFPNVYADMGETILFAPGEATEIYRELIGLAPASKLLFSTDASLVPELYWIGARIGRRALGRVLDEHIADGAIDEPTAIDWAERMLWRNSEAVYGL